MRPVLGIDLGASRIKAVVAGLDGAIHDRTLVPSRADEGPDVTLRVVSEIARRMIAEHHVRIVGVGVCGPVDYGAGRLIESPMLPGWSSVPVVDTIREDTGVPVVIENDASCAMLGEWWLGAGERLPVVAGFTIGTGVGGGLVLDGEIYRGGSGWGAELGHISLAPEPRCPCGGHGCVGMLASIPATLTRYRELGGSSEVDDLEELIRLGDEGDARATEALEASGGYLTDAARALVNVLNPNVLVLAGGMAVLSSALVDCIERGLRGTTFDGPDRTPVAAAKLGLYSGAIGAARAAALASGKGPAQSA
ncbi:MAG TPA: ROK family protein [Thermoleophilaceae bacterium]